MRLFLTILEGQNPIDAEPILATEDGRLIRLVGSWIAQQLHAQPDQEDETPQSEGGRSGGNNGS